MASNGTPGQTSPDLGTALIRGRISGKPRRFVTRDGGVMYETAVTMPAADEWSSPSTVPVRTSQAPGEVGDTFAGRVRIAGSARPFTYTDKVSGESKRGLDFSVYLIAVE